MRASQGDTTMTVQMMTVKEARRVLVAGGFILDESNEWVNYDLSGWIKESDGCFGYVRPQGTYTVWAEPHNVAGLIADIRAGKYKN
jgi:hypothetical protein